MANMGPDRRIFHFCFLFKVWFDTYTPLSKDTAWHTKKKNICPTQSKGIFPFVHELQCCLLFYQLRRGVGKQPGHCMDIWGRKRSNAFYLRLTRWDWKQLLPAKQSQVWGPVWASLVPSDVGFQHAPARLQLKSPHRQGDRWTRSLAVLLTPPTETAATRGAANTSSNLCHPASWHLTVPSQK